jgi:hypothetical protein
MVMTWTRPLLLSKRVCHGSSVGCTFSGLNLNRTLRSSGKERKEKGGFIGAEPVLKQLKDGPSRRRVGLIIEGAPARRK